MARASAWATPCVLVRIEIVDKVRRPTAMTANKSNTLTVTMIANPRRLSRSGHAGLGSGFMEGGKLGFGEESGNYNVITDPR